MHVLKDLEPRKVFMFFEEISQIPHGSGNTAQIADYCMNFAKQRGLKAIYDAAGNVIIYAPGTAGYENSEPLIIQGHMDMVCEKNADCTKNMDTDGLTLMTDGKYVWADGTTLGGDDGIALAYIFAIVDSDDIPHPPIEALITRDEETGMYGAMDFDPALISGTKILNIDSEEEGVLTVSCAGGITAHCVFEFIQQYHRPAYEYEISVSGLLGGHSGADIGKGRLNAFKMLSKPLKHITDCYFGTISGGGKMNVIPQNASVIIGSDDEKLDTLQQIVKHCNDQKYGGDTDPGLLFSVKEIDTRGKVKYLKNKCYLYYMYDFLRCFPTGVQTMSDSIEDMVETSLNLGVLELKDSELHCDFLIRSNSEGGKEVVAGTVRDFTKSIGDVIDFVEMTLSSEYPAWEYRKNSPLRDRMIEVFREQYGKEPIVAGIHAGLECGIFAKKIKDADIVSIGPDIADIHTPKERLDVASAARVWEYVKEILRRSR